MILVDTSVWVSHLREGNLHLVMLLNSGKVACHPFIIGELACGNIKNRAEILSKLHSLPKCLFVEYDEVLQFIEFRQLMGKGLGYIDTSLLASAILTDIPIWTLDKKLRQASIILNINYHPEE